MRIMEQQVRIVEAVAGHVYNFVASSLIAGADRVIATDLRISRGAADLLRVPVLARFVRIRRRVIAVPGRDRRAGRFGGVDAFLRQDAAVVLAADFDVAAVQPFDARVHRMTSLDFVQAAATVVRTISRYAHLVEGVVGRIFNIVC